MGVVMKIVRYRLRDKDVDHDAGLSYLPITDLWGYFNFAAGKVPYSKSYPFPIAVEHS